MTFGEWLDQNDLILGKWVTEHDKPALKPLTAEESENALERYLRNVKQIYGDQKATCSSCEGPHQCGACGGENPDCIWCHQQ
jgi:hypothetical protein